MVLDTYASHVSVFHVLSHPGLEENDHVDRLARQGRLQSPLWTLNKLSLSRRQVVAEDPDVQFLGTQETSPQHPQAILCHGHPRQ